MPFFGVGGDLCPVLVAEAQFDFSGAVQVKVDNQFCVFVVAVQDSLHVEVFDAFLWEVKQPYIAEDAAQPPLILQGVSATSREDEQRKRTWSSM